MQLDSRFSSIIAKNLLNLRTEAKKTQPEICEMAKNLGFEFNVSKLCRLENGNVRYVKTEDLEILSQVYEVPIEYFSTGEDLIEDRLYDLAGSYRDLVENYRKVVEENLMLKEKLNKIYEVLKG